MRNAWLDWPGMRPLVAARSGGGGTVGKWGRARPTPQDIEAAELREVAAALFKSHSWVDARPYFARLVALRPADPWLCAFSSDQHGLVSLG
jgi:hypothetical protein